MALHSYVSHELIGLPWQYLVVGLALCLILSALGFKRVAYFVSLGYAASIAAQAIVFSLLYRDTLSGFALLQSALLLAYGLRLGTFLTLRGQAPSFQNQQAENTARSAQAGGLMKLGIWVSVSVLYVLMFLPALLAMSAQSRGLVLASLPMGVALMVVGLGLEATADWQKSRFKKLYPARFCDVGLYRVVRFPNYFAEMLFWLGVGISAISAYRGLSYWVLGTLGFLCIELVMLGSSRRLELKQSQRYGSDAAFAAYARKVPILFPILPIYSLQDLKVSLG